MTDNHHVVLTPDEIGVWVTCSCGWGENLGLSVQPTDAVRAELRHVRDAMGITGGTG